MKPERSIMPERPPVEIAKRKPLTPKQRAELFATHKGVCHICSEKIKAGEPWDDEHVIQRWVSGDDSLANRRPAHRLKCHKAKTANDAGERAKIKRIQDRENGTRRERQPIPGRGFGPLTRKLGKGGVGPTRKAQRAANDDQKPKDQT